MVDVLVTPRIKCDNCGFEADKHSTQITNGHHSSWRPPGGWGFARIGGLYAGNDSAIESGDLCPSCMAGASDALSKFLNTSKEQSDG